MAPASAGGFGEPVSCGNAGFPQLGCQGRRDVGPAGRGKSVPPGAIVQHKGPCQLFREDVTQAIVAADGWMGNQDGFRGGLWVVGGFGGGVLPVMAKAVAVAVHLQDVDVVGEPVQQRSAEDLKEHFRPGGDRGTKPSSSMISRPRRAHRTLHPCRVFPVQEACGRFGPENSVTDFRLPVRSEGRQSGVLRELLQHVIGQFHRTV